MQPFYVALLRCRRSSPLLHMARCPIVHFRSRSDSSKKKRSWRWCRPTCTTYQYYVVRREQGFLASRYTFVLVTGSWLQPTTVSCAGSFVRGTFHRDKQTESDIVHVCGEFGSRRGRSTHVPEGGIPTHTAVSWGGADGAAGGWLRNSLLCRCCLGSCPTTTQDMHAGSTQIHGRDSRLYCVRQPNA